MAPPSGPGLTPSALQAWDLHASSSATTAPCHSVGSGSTESGSPAWAPLYLPSYAESLARDVRRESLARIPCEALGTLLAQRAVSWANGPQESAQGAARDEQALGFCHDAPVLQRPRSEGAQERWRTRLHR